MLFIGSNFKTSMVSFNKAFLALWFIWLIALVPFQLTHQLGHISAEYFAHGSDHLDDHFDPASSSYAECHIGLFYQAIVVLGALLSLSFGKAKLKPEERISTFIQLESRYWRFIRGPPSVFTV